MIEKVFSGTQKIRWIYAFGCLILMAYVCHCLEVNYVVDDSFITFRYVKNFVHGNGLVYNVGERVEGYTNFLWAMLLSGFLWVIPDINLLTLAQILGMIFGAATIFLTIKFSWLMHGKISVFGLIAGAFLALNSAFVAWSTGGLETIFFAFLVFAGFFSYVYSLKTGKKFLITPVLLSLAAMTRPEGLLFFAVTSIHLAVKEIQSGRKLVSRRTVGWVLAFAAIYVPYYLWRFSYYGYPFPNTFYAKVGAGIHQYLRGVRYLFDYLTRYGAFVFIIPLLLLLKKNREKWIDFLFLQVGVFAVYIVYIGGDGLAFFRFIACVVPLIYVLVQEGFRELYDWGKRHMPQVSEWKIALLTALLLVVSLGFTGHQTLLVLAFPNSHRWYEAQSELYFPGVGKDHSYVWFDNYFVDRQWAAARWLEAKAPPDAVVASTPAGSIAYYMNLKVIDMLGLNDLHIGHSKNSDMGKGRPGHEKGDGKYVLSRSPDYILLGNVAVLPKLLNEADMARKLVRKSEREIWADPDFNTHYERVTVKLSDEGVFKYFTFYKKRSVEDLQRISGQQKPPHTSSVSQ